MGYSVVLMCAISTAVVSSLFINPDYSRENKARRSLPKYQGCFKLEDTICARLVPANCSIAKVPFKCPRMCGKCAPFTPKCPEEYPFGCCWDGKEANDIGKSNCKKCKDISVICKRPVIKKDCDFSKATQATRNLCPEACGACYDYGYKPCEDSDPMCAMMEDTALCEESKTFRDRCKKTCGICPLTS